MYKTFAQFNKRTAWEVMRLSEKGIYYDFHGGWWFRIGADGDKKRLTRREVHMALSNKVFTGKPGTHGKEGVCLEEYGEGS